MCSFLFWKGKLHVFLYSLYVLCTMCAALVVLWKDKQVPCCMFKFSTDAKWGINKRKTNKRSWRPQWVICFLKTNESGNPLYGPPLSTVPPVLLAACKCSILLFVSSWLWIFPLYIQYVWAGNMIYRQNFSKVSQVY